MKGHIRERSPGHWAIVIDAQDAAGKRKRRWHSFQGTKRQAQIECARLISEMQGGGAVDPSRITVADFLDRFERDWAAVQVSPHSAGRYHGALGHVRRCLGEVQLQKVRPADIAQFYATLSRSGLAPSTIKLIHTVLHRALAQAKIWGVIRDNVVDSVKPPKIPDRETEMLQPDQARDLLQRLRGRPLYLLASLALATGMRRNEMLGLRWRDVDLDAGSLPAATVTELRNHWRVQQEQRLGLGIGRAPANSPVLAAFDGRTQSPNAITKAWPVAMAAIGMRGVTLHSLRHTHASMLIASGMDILTISRRLGHSSPTITLGVYGHLVSGTDDRAADIMDKALGSNPVAGNVKELGK